MGIHFLNHKPVLPLLFNLFLLTTMLQLSCTGQDSASERDRNVLKFLALLKDNNEGAIYDISYHVNYRNNITDEALRKQYVRAAAELINKYGIPPKDKWTTRKESSGAFVITIPFFKGNDTASRLTECSVTIDCPPEPVSHKPFDFVLWETRKEPNQDLTAPPRVVHPN
jgi:hypothetical protein